jgi:hypothetical protein
MEASGIAVPPKQSRTLAIGVRKPIVSASPAIAIETAVTSATRAVRPAAMSRVVWRIADAPTTTRDASSAMPVKPDGKLENALCSDMLLAGPATQHAAYSVRGCWESPG